MKNTYSEDFRDEETSIGTGTFFPSRGSGSTLSYTSDIGEDTAISQVSKKAKAVARLGMPQWILLRRRQKAKKQLDVEQAETENEYDKLAKKTLGIAQDEAVTKRAIF